MKPASCNPICIYRVELLSVYILMEVFLKYVLYI